LQPTPVVEKLDESNEEDDRRNDTEQEVSEIEGRSAEKE